jgi:hypothetical protein
MREGTYEDFDAIPSTLTADKSLPTMPTSNHIPTLTPFGRVHPEQTSTAELAAVRR